MAPALRGRELQRVLNLLIAENNIHFDHKVGKHKWPREHKDIFASSTILAVPSRARKDHGESKTNVVLLASPA
jgi:hypothetical protein